jgi:hypothetical protein
LAAVLLVAACCLAASADEGVRAPALSAGSSRPRVLVDKDEHDFGPFEVGVTGRHEFVLTNAGDGPLALSQSKSTCGCCTCVCTTQLPDPATIAPGKTGKLTMTWVSKMYKGPFRASVTLSTNDPERPEVTLRVAGRFGSSVQAVPPDLVLTRVATDRPTTGEFRLFAYLDQPLKIAAWHWADAATAKHFEAAFAPLTAEQLREEHGAKSGYRVRVSVQPGLPAGTIGQQLIVKTGFPSVPTVTIPVKGLAVGDVSIDARGWDAQRSILSVGVVASRQGGEWPLTIVVRGAHAKDAKIGPVWVSPEWLQVELGNSVQDAGGRLSQTRLIVRIPPATSPASYLGPEQSDLGRIVVGTSHPDVPRLQILLRFAVE